MRLSGGHRRDRLFACRPAVLAPAQGRRTSRAAHAWASTRTHAELFARSRLGKRGGLISGLVMICLIKTEGQCCVMTAPIGRRDNSWHAFADLRRGGGVHHVGALLTPLIVESPSHGHHEVNSHHHCLEPVWSPCDSDVRHPVHYRAGHAQPPLDTLVNHTCDPGLGGRIGCASMAGLALARATGARKATPVRGLGRGDRKRDDCRRGGAHSSRQSCRGGHAHECRVRHPQGVATFSGLASVGRLH